MHKKAHLENSLWIPILHRNGPYNCIKSVPLIRRVPFRFWEICPCWDLNQVPLNLKAFTFLFRWSKILWKRGGRVLFDFGARSWTIFIFPSGWRSSSLPSVLCFLSSDRLSLKIGIGSAASELHLKPNSGNAVRLNNLCAPGPRRRLDNLSSSPTSKSSRLSVICVKWKMEIHFLWKKNDCMVLWNQ